MDMHENARSCPASRELLVDRVLRQGWSVGQAAEAIGVSERTGYEWLARYRAEGCSGLADRSSRPHRVPHRTAAVQVRRILALRRRRLCGAEIAARLGMSRTTVARILRREGLHRLRALDPPEAPRRYEKQHPGAERLIQTLLREWAYRFPYLTSRSRAQRLTRYLHFNNCHRMHQALDGLPPLSRVPRLNNVMEMHN